MADSVLYFPSIRPPDNEWFARVLLYWDQVGTILPKELADNDEFLRPYTSSLIKEKLLVPVSPEPAFWWGDAVGHIDAFLDLIDRQPGRVEGRPVTEDDWVRVHLTKIGYGLGTALAQRGLCREPVFESDASLWLHIEVRTANLLMAYLAAIVAKDYGIAMDPITDSEAALAAFKGLPDGERHIDTDMHPIRFALLDHILPGPAAGVEPARLAEFKNEHADLLTRFRTRVERGVIDCAQVSDERQRAKHVSTVRAELTDELVEIERRMSERRWPTVVRGSVGVVIAALGIADLAATGGTTFAAASGVLGLGGAIDTALQGRRRAELFKSPLAFAAIARREFHGACVDGARQH